MASTRKSAEDLYRECLQTSDGKVKIGKTAEELHRDYLTGNATIGGHSGTSVLTTSQTNPTAVSSGVNVSVGKENPMDFLKGLRAMRTAPPFESALREEQMVKDLKDSYTELTELQTKVQQVEATGKQLEQEGAQLQQEYANVGKLLQTYEATGSNQDAEAYLLAVDAYNKRHTAFQQAWTQYEKDSTVFDQYNKAYSKYEKAAGKYLQAHPEMEQQKEPREWGTVKIEFDDTVRQGEQLQREIDAVTEEMQGAFEYAEATGTATSSQHHADMIRRRDDLTVQLEANEKKQQALKQELAQAQRINWQSMMENEDFETYAAKGAAIENPEFHDMAYGKMEDLSVEEKREQIGNIVTYSVENKGQSSLGYAGGDATYQYLTEDEIKIYNYLLAKYGKKTGQIYLDYMQETLNARAGAEEAKYVTQIESPFLRTAAAVPYGIQAGVDQFGSGMKQLVSEKTLPTSKTQYASQEIAGSLGKAGQVVYSAATTVGNMLPSIMVSAATGGTAGMVLGSATMGLASAGNAYAQAKKEGYTTGQAATYGALVGASEATLQYLLGGIGKLGGVTDDLLLAKVRTVDKAFARIALTGVVKIGSEVAEEELQLFLEPLFRTAIFGEGYDLPTGDEMLETLIVTALSTGALEAGGIAGVEIDHAKFGKQMKQEYGASALVDAVLKNAPGGSKSHSLAEKLKAQIDAGHMPSDLELGRLCAENYDAIKTVHGQRNTMLSESDLEEYLHTGIREHVRNAKYDQIKMGNSPILTSWAAVKDFIQKSIAGKVRNTIKGYGKVGNRLAADISEKSEGSVLVGGYYLELDSNRLEHLSDHVQDSDPRNIPLSEEQIIEIPQYINTYDEVLNVARKKDGGVRIMLGKKINGHSVIVCLASKGRSSLQPVTAWQNKTEHYIKLYKNGAYTTSQTATKTADSGYTHAPEGATSLASSNANVSQPAQTVNENNLAETDGVQWAGNAPAEEETADALEQLRQDYAEGKITDEEFDEAMEIIRQEESAAEESMVEGLQWAGSEIATTPVDMVDGTVTENNNIETEDMTYGEQQEQSSGRDGARIGKHSGRRAGEDRKRGRARAAQRRSVESTQVRADVKNLGVKPTSLEKLGLSIGSDLEANWEVPRAAWNESIQTAADYAAEHGLKFVPVVGNMYVKIGDKLLRVEAAIENGVIYVQADSMTRDVIEVTIHEIFHHRISGNKELQDRIVEYIQQNYDMEEVSELFDKYRKIYREFVKGMAPDKQAEYIWQEMLADAYAELERFPETEGPVQWSEYVREAMEQAETKNTANGGARMSAAVGQGAGGEYDTDVGYKEYDVESAVYDIRYHRADQSKDLVYIGTMPMLNRELFGLKGNVYVSNAHLYQNMVSKDEAIADGRWTKGVDYHGLGEEKVSNAIIQSQNPIVLMESLKDYESPRLVAIVEEKGKDGLPLIVVTELYANRLAYGEKQNRNHVLITVYEKSQLPSYVKNTLEKGRVLHIKEGLSTDTLSNLQLAGNISEEVLKQNVAQFNKKIKAFKEKNKINFSMAGEGALTADEASLQMAKDMMDMGEDMEAIHETTGWYQGRDGKWRFEIDDSGMTYYRGGDAQFRKDHPEYARYRDLELAFIEGTITEEETAELRELHETWVREYARLSDRVDRGNATLGNILDHEELYAAYPALRDMKVVFKDLDGVRGEIDHQRGKITLDKSLRNAPESTLLHEIQHAIQNTEGFAGGSSPEYWQGRGYEDAAERYQNTAGEIEARDVSRRRALTAEERRQRMPDLGGEGTVFADQMDRNGQAIGRTTDNRPFVEVEDDILAGVPKADWVVTVKENLKKKFPNEIVVGRSEINIDGQSRKELTYSGYMQWLYNNDPTLYADKLRATDNADEILLATTDWVNEGLNHPRKDRIIDFARGSVLLRIGGNDYSAEVVVGTRKNGSMLLYDVLQLTPVSFIAKETDAATSTNPSPGTARSTASVSGNAAQELSRGVTVSGSLADTTSTASGDIISKDADGVNTRFSMTTEQDLEDFADWTEEVLGRRMTPEEFAASMDASKARPPQGRIKEIVDGMREKYENTARDGHLYKDPDMSDEEYAALDEKWQNRTRPQQERPETAEQWIIPKKRFTSTPAMEKLGIKIDGSVTRYRQTEQMRAYERAAKHAEYMVNARFKALGPTDGELDLAKLLVRGTVTADMLDSQYVDLEKVLELADYIAAADSFSQSMIAMRREEIDAGNAAIAKELFEDADNYSSKLKLLPRLTKAVMNYREAERICRQIFGDEKGVEIYRKVFRPVWVNGAEINLFKDRMLQRVAAFRDQKGKTRALTVKEREFAQRLMEGEAVVETFEKLKPKEQETVRQAAEALNGGKNSENVARELELNDYLLGVAQAYADYMDTVAVTEDMDKIIMHNAIAEYRKIYNELYDAINDFLVSHGYEEIGFIKNYAPHFQKQDVQQGLLGALIKMGVEKEGAMELPASIAGRTADFKPNMRWNPHAQTREGKKTDYDILVGFERYLHYASEMFYHTDDVMRVRQIVNYFRQKYSSETISKAIEEAQPGTLKDAEWKLQFLRDKDVVRVTDELTEKQVHERYKQYLDELYKQATPESLQQHSEFVMWMDDYANILAGKQSYADRGQEAWGRGTLNFPNKLVRHFALANVAGNVSSALNQMAQLPMIQTNLGIYAERAMWDMLWGRLRKEGFRESSVFLTDKRGVDRLSATNMEKFISGLFKPATIMDEMVTTIAVRGRYLQALHEGMAPEEAMEAADDYGRRTMGSRMKGAKPIAFENKGIWMQMLNQFQIEAVNTFDRVTFDAPRAVKSVAKKKGKIAATRYAAAGCLGYLISAFIHNLISDELYGGTPAPLDLLGWLTEFCADLWDESEVEWLKTVLDNACEKMFGERPFGTQPHEKDGDGLDWAGAYDDLKYNVVDDIPLLRNASSLLGWGDQSGPLAGVGEVAQSLMSAGKTLKDQVFKGEEETGLDWAGAVKSIVQDLGEAGTTFLPGGRQIRKTLQGITAVARGGKYRNFGENTTLQYPVEQNAWNAIRAGLFGLGPLDETDEFYAGEKALNKKQTQVLKELEELGVDRFATYGLYQDFRQLSDDLTGAEEKNAKRDLIDALGLNDEQKMEVYLRTVVSSTAQKQTREKYQYLLERGVGWSQITQLENAYALFNADLDEDGEADMTALEKGVAKRNEIAALQLTDEQKLEVFDRYHLRRDEDSYEQTRAEYEAMLDEGLSWDEITQAHNTYAELNADDALTATQRATQYAKWADEQNWNKRQIEAVKDRYQFWQMIPAEAERYEKFTGAGLSSSVSDKLTKALDTAKETKGELKTLDRYRVVIDACSTDKEAMTALSAMMSEEQFAKVEIANGFGVSADDWLSFKEEWADTYGEDSVSQKKVETILNGMYISDSTKAALWQIANKSWKPSGNPYSRNVGQDIYDRMN